ncbi:hypothetical protein PG985_000383 [Apiospora marii]|uniref:uncharacterized protein n=1 Tax=Apiospora marii TaxID=335849 RepID=UPI00313063E4
MPGQARPAAGPEAAAEVSSSGPSAQSKPPRVKYNHLQYFTDFNDDQLDALASELGKWEKKSSCVRKGCTHLSKSLCWDQVPVYPVDTTQPSFYLPRVIQNLPASLSQNRKQWMYTCLLAKYYRVPINITFSAIKLYNNNISPIHKGRKNQVELDAYSLCILYNAGRFIDKRGLLLDRLPFLKPYPTKEREGFDWKFEENRDRVFRWYDDGRWEEYLPDENPDDAEGIPHDVKVELTLVYSRFLGLTNGEGGNTNEFQKAAARALKQLLRKPRGEAVAEVTDLEEDQADEDQEDASQAVSSRDQSLALLQRDPLEHREDRVQQQRAQQTPIRERPLHLQLFQAKLSDALNDLFEAEGAHDKHNYRIEIAERSELPVDADAQPRTVPAPVTTPNDLDNEQRTAPEEEGSQIPSVEADNANEGNRALDQIAKPTKRESPEPGPAARRIKSEVESSANGLKEESPSAESKLDPDKNSILREAAEQQAATMKRKYEETLEELNEQKEQYHKLALESKKEQARGSKRQKLLHVHVESIYRKWDTGKMLQDESNGFEGALEQVHDTVDHLKQSMASDRAQLRKIVEAEDAEDVRKQLRDWVVREEANAGGKMDNLEKLLSSDAVARPMDVAMELKESYATWVKTIKPRLDREQPGV